MMLAVRALRANYGRIPILNGIDFEVAEGEVVGILGHNGMGKTTLMRTLMGFVPAVGGSVTFQRDDVTREPPHRRARRGLGYVPQGREIFPRLSVRENLRMAAIASGGADESAVEEVLADFPRLRPLLDRQGGVLSGGEQQILAIARCLCTRPRLVLLDEPTESLQPSIIQQIAENLAALRANRGLTVVLVEQNLDFVAALSNRVLIIQKGAILRELEPGRLREAAVVEEFVGMGPAS
jgi:branched-chain amino acid transport system ATP-binding protein